MNWQGCRPGPSLTDLAEELALGQTTSRKLTEVCLERILADGGEGARVFPHGVSDGVLAAADAQDRLRSEGRAATPLAGIPISIKDNIDLAGEVTRVGSHLFDREPVAVADASVAARLRAAGFVILGHTNMTELAFSGLGVNPHYGTPVNPRSTDVRRIPGGSSSGAATSVAGGMANAAIGTDTGGSCRIPAAFCGVVGFKPTSTRVSKVGVYPLSPTLDCVGCFGVTALCCAIVDGVMAGEAVLNPPLRSLSDLKLAVLEGYPLLDVEPEVAAAFGAAIDRLKVAGLSVTYIEAPELEDVGRMNARGGFASAELYGLLRDRLSTDSALVDPRVLTRVMFSAEHAPSDYTALQRARAQLLKDAAVLDAFDAVLTPTTPIRAPRFEDVAADADYARLNRLALRNPSILNMLDRPAISIPCEADGELPVGLSLAGRPGGDRDLLAIAIGLENLIRGR